MDRTTRAKALHPRPIYKTSKRIKETRKRGKSQGERTPRQSKRKRAYIFLWGIKRATVERMGKERLKRRTRNHDND